MLATPDEAAVRAAERSVRRILRGQYSGYTRDDLLQEGRLAAWVVRQAGRVPDDPEHARRYLARRTQGAMLDHVRACRRQLPQNTVELELQLETQLEAQRQHHLPPSLAMPDPTAGLRVRDVMRLLRRSGSERLLDCVRLLAAGHDPAEVAATLGVSDSRVSQLRRRARELAAQAA